MEIVLGIDNVVFLTILAGRLPAEQQAEGAAARARVRARDPRSRLLFAISWVMGLTRAAVLGAGHGFSGRDLILLVGGLFLIAKATFEIHDKLEVKHEAGAGGEGAAARRSGAVIVQIGAPRHRLLARLGHHRGRHGAAPRDHGRRRWSLAVGVMLVFAGPIGDFVERHPTMKMLALSFLILIGVMLVAEGFGKHIDEGLHLLRDGVLARSSSSSTCGCGARGAGRLHHRFEQPGAERYLAPEASTPETQPWLTSRSSSSRCSGGRPSTS